MSKLKAGFSRVNINPMMGIPIKGYFKVRLADGILDDIEANALALWINVNKVDSKKRKNYTDISNASFWLGVRPLLCE